MLRTWWRRWTGLAELESRIDTMIDEVERSRLEVATARREMARERSRVPMFNELVAEKDAEIQRLIREVGSLERQVRERGDRPVTFLNERLSLPTATP